MGQQPPPSSSSSTPQPRSKNKSAPAGSRTRCFYGTFIHSKSRQHLDYLHDTSVVVNDHGKIQHVKRRVGGLQAARQHAAKSLQLQEEQVQMTTPPEGGFFFPGFIDTHCHASQYPNIGIFGKSTLLDWLDKYTFPMESSLADLPKARRVYSACVRKTLSHGTTTIAYYATIDVPATNCLADVCRSLGQRAFVGRVCMDRRDLCPDYYRDEGPEDTLAKTKQSIDYIQSLSSRKPSTTTTEKVQQEKEEQEEEESLVTPIVTPRFAPSCTAEAMTLLGTLAREKDLPIQTHVSENPSEIALVARLFPQCPSYTAVYDGHGLLTPRTILAHAVHLTEAEALLIAQRGAKVSHCPCSNSSLTSGAARVRWLWDVGIHVGLGTDMSGGYSPSVLESARQASLVSRHVAMGTTSHNNTNNNDKDGTIKNEEKAQQQEAERSKLSVEEVLYLATRGGAHVVGLSDRVGGFEVGMDFDAQMITLAMVDEQGEGGGGDVEIFGWETWDEKVAKWVFNGDDRNTKMVWVRGRMVHEKR